MSMPIENGAAFASARPLAQHCAELLARVPRPEERAEALAAWRRDCAGLLAGLLGELLTGDRPKVTIGEPETLGGGEVFSRIGPVAANVLLRGGPGECQLLLSLDFATAIALTDRSFGGEGEPDENETPERLPRSVGLLVEQFAMLVARAISAAGENDADAFSTTGAKPDVIARSDSAARLKPFEPGAPCALFTLTVTVAEDRSWSVLLALPEDQLDTLLPGTPPAKGPVAKCSPDEAAMTRPFARIPLKLEAVLAEFDLSLGRLEGLRPGDEIPLAVPRAIPLRLGGEVFASGSLGTFEDRMALRLTVNPADGGIS